MPAGQPGSDSIPGPPLLPEGDGGDAGVTELLVPSAMALAVAVELFVPSVMALSKVPPLAVAAPSRPTQMPAILTAFPPGLFDHNPRALPVLTVTVGSSWRVDGDLFEVFGGAVPFTCDLRAFTLGQLATALSTAGYTATAALPWSAVAATVLLDGDGRFADDPKLYGFTTVLYRLLRTIVLAWDRLADDLDEGARQFDLRTATAAWLDWWGSIYGVPRDTLENDTRYRARILYSTVKPRTNNVALENAILAILGVAATVADVLPNGPLRARSTGVTVLDRLWSGQARPGRLWPGYGPQFTVTVPGATDDLTIARIRALVGKFKAAGVTYAVVRS